MERIDANRQKELWNPPPPPSTPPSREHPDAIHADYIEKIPHEAPTCSFEDLEHVAACPTNTVKPSALFVKAKGDVSAADPNDIKQRGLGDCYLFAAASAMMQTPDGRKRIEQMITEKTVNGKAGYEVTFREPISQSITPEGFHTRAYHDVKVWVDAKFIQGHADVGDTKGKKQEVWPLVLEKGYAEYNKGYQNMARGGASSDALIALTGRDANNSVLGAGYGEAQLVGDFIAKKPIVVLNVQATVPLDGSASVPQYNLYSNHAYAVTNVYLKDGETYVQLSNPWGFDQPKTIPLSKLEELHPTVAVGEKPDVD